MRKFSRFGVGECCVTKIIFSRFGPAEKIAVGGRIYNPMRNCGSSGSSFREMMIYSSVTVDVLWFEFGCMLWEEGV